MKWINPPKYDEISVANLYPKFKGDPNVTIYLPTKLAKGKLPDCAYFFNVLNTVYEDRMTAMIAHANSLRFAGHKGIEEETVMVTDEWWDKLNSMPYFSCKCSLISLTSS